jgi:hypothetical protein
VDYVPVPRFQFYSPKRGIQEDINEQQRFEDADPIGDNAQTTRREGGAGHRLIQRDWKGNCP